MLKTTEECKACNGEGARFRRRCVKCDGKGTVEIKGRFVGEIRRVIRQHFISTGHMGAGAIPPTGTIVDYDVLFQWDGEAWNELATLAETE